MKRDGRGNKKLIGVALCALVLALGFSVEAQPPKKIHRIGYLMSADPAFESIRTESIRLALRELGHVEGQNILFEYLYADGKPDRLFGLAEELVDLKVDLIVVAGGM